jgi:hypothetical protein
MTAVAAVVFSSERREKPILLSPNRFLSVFLAETPWLAFCPLSPEIPSAGLHALRFALRWRLAGRQSDAHRAAIDLQIRWKLRTYIQLSEIPIQ